MMVISWQRLATLDLSNTFLPLKTEIITLVSYPRPSQTAIKNLLENQPFSLIITVIGDSQSLPVSFSQPSPYFFKNLTSDLLYCHSESAKSHLATVNLPTRGYGLKKSLKFSRPKIQEWVLQNSVFFFFFFKFSAQTLFQNSSIDDSQVQEVPHQCGFWVQDTLLTGESN